MLGHLLSAQARLRSLGSFSLQKRALRRKSVCEEIHRGADAGGSLEIVVREQPERRSRLRERLGLDPAQIGREVADIARQQSETQSFNGCVAQSGKGIDPAGDVHSAHVLMHPLGDHRARQRIIERDPVVSRQLFLWMPGQVGLRARLEMIAFDLKVLRADV